MNKFFTLIFWMTCLALNAQKIELDQVTIEELSQTQHPLFPDAEAAVMFEKGDVRLTYFQSEGFMLEIEVICKIKIYKKEGFKFATIAEGYVSEGNREMVTFSKAVTYNLANGKIEKTKLKSDGEFSEKISKSFTVKKITFPNVKEGSIIEYKMYFKTPSWDRVRPWRFQKEIPVDFSQLATVFPDYVRYSTNMKGYLVPKVVANKSVRKVYLGVNNDREIPETKTEYTIQYAEPMKDEGFVHNIDNYASILEHELASYQFPGDAYKDFTNSWEGVAKFVNDSERFGVELKNKGYFEAELTPILAGATTPAEKMVKTYEWLKSKVKWNENFGIFCNDGVKKAFKNSTGNVAEINLMLTAMLRYAGISANPVLVSTRANGISFFPSTNAFNYVVSAAEIDGKIVYLDATDQFATPDVVPLRTRNWVGRLIKDNGTSTQVNLDVKQISKYQKMIKVKVGEDGKLQGEFKGQYTDYAALLERNRYAKKTKETNVEQLERRYKGIEIENLEFQNLEEAYQNLLLQFQFTSNDFVEMVGNKMYISPLMFMATNQNPFSRDVRKYPVNFPFPYQDAYVINIEIPEGYSVEYLPKSEQAKMEEDMVGFRYMISQREGMIQIMLQENYQANLIPTDYYSDLKSIMQMIINKENDRIVLVKN